MNLTQVLYSFGPLLLLIVLLLIKKVNFKKIINGIFFGIITIIIEAIFAWIIGIFVPISNDAHIAQASILLIMLTAAIPEEISKLIGIKLSKGKDKNDIFVYSMLVAFFFKAFEDYLYFNRGFSNIGLTRLLMPGHILFGLVMSYFLIKAKDNKKSPYNVLALVVPIIIHTIFNGFITINNIVAIIGIIIYILVIIKVLLLKPINKDEPKFWILKLIVIIGASLLVLPAMSFETTNFGEEKTIDNNITMKLIEVKSKQTVIGDKFCAEAQIINNQSKTLTLSALDFKLYSKAGNDPVNAYTLSEYEVEGNSTKNIEICFDDNKEEHQYIRYSRIFSTNNEVFFDLK